MVDYEVIKPGRQRFTAKKYCNHCTKAGLRPATQIRNQGVPAWLSLILAAHRVPLRGVRRESHRVIRSAVKTAMSHARTSLSIPDNFLFFLTAFQG